MGAFLPILNALPDIPKLFSHAAETRREAVLAGSVALTMHLAPLFFQPGWKGPAAVASSSMLTSLFTLLSFHTSHLGEQLEVRLEPGMDWGEHQMRTSTNFGAEFGLGGTLDLQIEHHLFPMLSYENQQSIIPIIKETAEDFGIPYHRYDGILTGMHCHLKYMGSIGWKSEEAGYASSYRSSNASFHIEA